MKDSALPAGLRRKESDLLEMLRGWGSIAVAYSGGVDSTLLADLAHEALSEKAYMVLFDSPVTPRNDVREAQALAAEKGWQFFILPTSEFECDSFLRNDTMRCYYCKLEKLRAMKAWADARDIAVLAHGENTDDLKDETRVGSKAAKELGAAAPLAEAGLTKEEIRALSRARGLPTAGKASFACLATRIPTGQAIDADILARIEGIEDCLRESGFHQYRVRHHDDLCRIEIMPEEFPRILDPSIRETVLQAARDAGYKKIALDLAGYRHPVQTHSVE